MAVKLEKEIEQRLVAMVKRHGGWCLKFICPGWSGVPDRILLLPGGVVYFVETKRPKGGRLSKLQKWWREEFLRLGFWYSVIWTDSNVDTLEQLIIADLERQRLRGCSR